jgi:hypothetical protein
LPSANPPSVPSANADLADLQKIHAAKPGTKEVLERFKDRVTFEPNSTKFTIDLKTRKEIKEFSEMRDRYRPLAVERALKKNGVTPKVRMRHPSGEIREVAEGVAAAAEKQGMRWAPSRKATHIWRDGVWYRREGREWVPEYE